MGKVSPIKRTIPAYTFNETEKAIINEHFQYRIIPVIVGGKSVNCIEFEEDVFDVLDDIESYQLFESDMSDSEKKGLAMRMSAVCFQCVRELNYVNGANLIEIGKSLKIIGRCIALACVSGLAILDPNQARRLLPIIRAI